MKNNTSEEWKHPGNRQELLRSALLQAMGYTDIDISKPIIGIVNTWAETNPCIPASCPRRSSGASGLRAASRWRSIPCPSAKSSLTCPA